MHRFPLQNPLLTARQLLQYRIGWGAADGQLFDREGQFGPFPAAGAEAVVPFEKVCDDLTFQCRATEMLIDPNRELRPPRVIAHDAVQWLVKFFDHLLKRLYRKRTAVKGQHAGKPQLDNRFAAELAAPTLDMASTLLEQFYRRLARVNLEEDAYKWPPGVSVQDRAVLWLRLRIHLHKVVTRSGQATSVSELVSGLPGL